MCFSPYRLLLPIILISSISLAKAQYAGEKVYLNQIGFYPEGPKKALVIGEISNNNFYVIGFNTLDTVFRGQLNAAIVNPYSKKNTRLADFSTFKKTGKFILTVPGVGASFPFEIKNKIFEPLAKASIKGFYYQRASIALEEKDAGKWARKEGHSDNKIFIHPSAATNNKPAQSIISSSKGWYDAGDYNKYIVNSGITVGTLFSLFEDYPEYLKTVALNIPESKNQLPDLLDETLWNLRWMLTMQDADDGGVYHKLSNANFDGMVMPDKAIADRFVVEKSTAATLDFAANMAQAYRIFKKYNKVLPGLSDSCIIAAKKAWDWARKNPQKLYLQNEMNKNFDPDILTGEYGDQNINDELSWAASELFISTKDEKYKPFIDFKIQKIEIPSWSGVATLGYYSLLRFEKDILLTNETGNLKKMLIEKANEMVKEAENCYNQTAMCANAKNFVWGSNAVAANQGILLLQAYRITKNKKYIDAAHSNLDYLTGRNMTGYCFVTGFGNKTTLHPHHRPSEADGIIEPVPGLLAGGPNPGQQDHCKYATNITDESYSDDVCSYASNEIAINWNAPLVYLTFAMEAIRK